MRTVLITGAAKGIGYACASVFSQAEWRVIGIDTLAATNHGPFESYMRMDLQDQEALSAAVLQLIADEEELCALVNNAAVQMICPLLDTSAKYFEMTMSINAITPLLITKLIFPLLRKNRGAVVNISSVHSIATSPDIGTYAASKAALSSLTRTMALEFGCHGVRANAVLPGAIDTDMLRAGLMRNQISDPDDMAKRHALGRIGQPEEVAQVVLFLADTEKSSFITGQCIVVDGGCVARLSTE